MASLFPAAGKKEDSIPDGGCTHPLAPSLPQKTLERVGKQAGSRMGKRKDGLNLDSPDYGITVKKMNIQ